MPAARGEAAPPAKRAKTGGAGSSSTDASGDTNGAADETASTRTAARETAGVEVPSGIFPGTSDSLCCPDCVSSRHAACSVGALDMGDKAWVRIRNMKRAFFFQ